jgi:hypothetical protein
MPYGKTIEAFELDDVTRYIFHNYFDLLTVMETLAWKTYIVETKAGHSRSGDYRAILRRQFGTSDPTATALLDKGPEHFFTSVRDRVLREHANTVVLNKCPRCGALCRSPEAKLCPQCNYCWRAPSVRHET